LIETSVGFNPGAWEKGTKFASGMVALNEMINKEGLPEI